MSCVIRVIGAGPAGTAAAIAALSESLPVTVYERSRFPRHKVCGEFLSPEAGALLEKLGVGGGFLALRPARLRRCVLHFGRRSKSWTLPDCAYGLSRLELDRLLLAKAEALGATVIRGENISAFGSLDTVLAAGRRFRAPRGNRLFGFKAHFEGPATDSIELYFGKDSYIGVGSIESGLTNVCGIAPEQTLAAYGFRIDDFVSASEILAVRLRPLTRRMKWLTVGPLVFSGIAPTTSECYLAGDALGFIDPFTGSGILNALLTGYMAGRAAAHGVAPDQHLLACRRLLERPFGVSRLLRMFLSSALAQELAAFVPGIWLYRLTRVA